ncbi:MAG: hypothetical protein ACRDTH_06765 [Pseudonocardiaceae bacterium]
MWRGRAVHEAMAEQQEAMLDLFADIRAAVASNAPRTVLEDGEILLMINIMTVRTTEAM